MFGKNSSKILSVCISMILILVLALTAGSPAVYAAQPTLTEVTLQQDGYGAFYNYTSNNCTSLTITMSANGENHSITVTPAASAESVCSYFLTPENNVFSLEESDFGKTLSLTIKGVNAEGEYTVTAGETITMTPPSLHIPDPVDCALLTHAKDIYDISVVSGISWTNGSAITRRTVEKQNGDIWEPVDSDHVMTSADGGVYRIRIETILRDFYSNTFTVYVPEVNYVLDGGTLPDSAVTAYMPDDLPVELPVPERKNYTFGGWYETADFSGSAVSSVPEGSVGDKTYYAKWTPVDYRIHFDPNGGNDGAASMPDQYYTCEDTKALSENAFGYTGHSFAGWTADPDGSGAKYSDGAPVSDIDPVGDITLYAQWSINEYDVTWIDGDNTELYTGKTEYGQTPVYGGETPVREADAGYTYTFAGWTPEISPVAGDTTYTATYTATPVDYTVTWMSDGKEYKKETVPYGGDVAEPEAPAKENYEFTGWDAEIPAAMPAENLTFSALFIPTEYTASFVDENGKTVGEIKYTVETESITPPEIPAKEGYTGKWEEYKLTAGGITVKPVYTAIPAEETPEEPAAPLTIKGNRRSVLGYKENQTFTADVTDLPKGSEVHWFVNGEDAGTGGEYKVVGPKDDYTVQAKVIDKDGNILSESAEQNITVKHGFLDKVLFFFAYLIKLFMTPFWELEGTL